MKIKIKIKSIFPQMDTDFADKRFRILSSVICLQSSEPHGGTTVKGQDQEPFVRGWTLIDTDGKDQDQKQVLMCQENYHFYFI